MLRTIAVGLAALAASACIATVSTSGPERGTAPPTVRPTGPTAERPAEPAEPVGGGPAEGLTEVAGACETSADCPEGTVCAGDEGCDAVWSCAPARPCTRDLAPFCGCDGQTFRGSSSCPPRRYARRGACERPVGPAITPPPPDRPAVATCSSSADCPEGFACRGPEGCTTPWTCQPSGPCTLDLVPYCGCDGTTVRGSSRCPPRPYRHRGACTP